MTARALVDTNVFVYLFDSSAPAKRRQAEALLEERWAAGTLVVSVQVLQELFVVLTRKLQPRVPVETAIAALEPITVRRPDRSDRDHPPSDPAPV